MSKVNVWTAKSLEWASQHDYLDKLFSVYPMHNNLKRSIPEYAVRQLETYFDEKNSGALVTLLLKQEIFPIKDSYVASLKRDPGALDRNPRTLARLAGMLYEMGLSNIIENVTAPKETNRQIGPLFKNWLEKGVLGCKITRDENEFINSKEDIIFLHSDTVMQQVAHAYLGYKHDKGLDFLGKFQGKFILGEAKFLTDFGGHQTAQFNDAIATVTTSLKPCGREVIKIAILDGVVYIPGKNKIHTELLYYSKKYPLMSALVFRDFLYSL